MPRIHTILTHPKPYLDEIVAIWLLMEYGQGHLPGVSNATIGYWNDVYDERNRQTSDDQWLEQGFLLIGVGGVHKDNQCLAMLVAKRIGVNDFPELQMLLKYTLEVDTNQIDLPWAQFSWSLTIKRLHGRIPDNQIIDRVFEDIEDLVDQQRVDQQKEPETDSFDDCVQDWPEDDDAAVLRIQVGHKDLGIAFVASDRDRMHAWVRFAHRDVDLVVIRRSNGHCHIFCCDHEGRPELHLDSLVTALRLAELKARGLPSQGVNNLRSPACQAVPQWYYPNPLMILNGSKSHPEVEVTALTTDQIRDLIKTNLIIGRTN